jgi:hypothetical protein
MTNEITKPGKTALTFNGGKARSTDDQVLKAIAPIFAAYPHAKVTDEMLSLYKMMLRDIDPDVLVYAVLAAIAVCKFPPTIADIREQVEATKRTPGPESHVDMAELKPVPRKMFRLDPDEDRQRRMEQLRRTEQWGKHYS